MTRWTDLAVWRGPTPNRNAGGMREWRGIVVHIAEGTYEGTISWQKNNKGSNRTSSHFIVSRNGNVAQMVDTADASWAQRTGNSTWLSAEFEGFTTASNHYRSGWERLSGQQCAAASRLLVKAHRLHGVPLTVAHSPADRGLGYHSMDREWMGEQWGHDACPGRPIIDQLPGIVLAARGMITPTPPANQGGNMIGVRYGQVTGQAAVYAGDGLHCRWVPNEVALAAMRAEQQASGVSAERLKTRQYRTMSDLEAVLGRLDGPAGTL